MSNKFQQKYEVREPQNRNEDAATGWVSAASARTKKGMPGREGRPCGDSESRHMNNALFLNSLPCGMDIEDQETADIRVQEISSGNLGNGDQATTDVTAESLRCGFSRKKMLNTDDQFTHEHQDVFYEDATVDGITGFLERGNVLDRS